MTNKNKILFIQPTIYDNRGKLVKKDKLYFIGLTMPLLAALTPASWEVSICIETIEEIPFDTDASVIGIGSMGHSVVRGIEIAKEFKKRGKTVIFGGYMASLVSAEVKKYCDSVVIGDAEECWPQALKDYSKDGVLKPFYKQKLKKLSTPLPRYELVTNKDIGDFLPVQAGRGCPNSCSFCSIACLYQTQYLRRNISEVIRDIKRIKELGFKKFLLIDDNILANKKYITKLCREIKKLGMTWSSQCAIDLARDPKLLKLMVDSGCTTLSFGVESITKSNLQKLNKSWCHPEEYRQLIQTIRNAGIDVATEMMIGLDNDSQESLKETAKFLIENKVEFPKFYIITPIPGTKYYEEVKNSAMLVNKNIYEYSPSKAAKRTETLSVEDIDRIFWELYNEVYSVKNIFKRILLTKKVFMHPQRVLFNLGVNLLYRYHIKNDIAPIIV
jgi:radical SAM superfamily enzyme YgiQ (UPF0313 family)